MKSATVPEVAIVSPAQDYTDLDGNLVKAEEMDLCVRSISVGQVHKAYPITGAVGTGSGGFGGDLFTEAVHSQCAERTIRTPKLYFRDTGLACYLTRWLTAETLACGAFSGHIFETFVISEILKSFSNAGLDYRYFVSYYRGRDRKRVKKNGEMAEPESEIDFIIEENGILYPVGIKKSGSVTPDVTGSFLVLDKIEGKNRFEK